VVVRGAAIHWGVLFGEEPVILPLSLEIETGRGIFSEVFGRHTIIPSRRTRTISTIRDNQSKIEIEIYEGQRPLASRNHHIGIFVINGIRPARKDVPQIDIFLEYDSYCNLKIKLEEKMGLREVELLIKSPRERNDDKPEEEFAFLCAQCEKPFLEPVQYVWNYVGDWWHGQQRIY
jgi:molecular chaperone DnaK